MDEKRKRELYDLLEWARRCWKNRDSSNIMRDMPVVKIPKQKYLSLGSEKITLLFHDMLLQIESEEGTYYITRIWDSAVSIVGSGVIVTKLLLNNKTV